MFKNHNWQEADELVKNKVQPAEGQLRSNPVSSREESMSLGPTDYRTSAPTTWLHCFRSIEQCRYSCTYRPSFLPAFLTLCTSHFVRLKSRGVSVKFTCNLSLNILLFPSYLKLLHYCAVKFNLTNHHNKETFTTTTKKEAKTTRVRFHAWFLYTH